MQYRDQLPLQDYEENKQHGWLPYVKKIPARFFDVSDEVITPELCLYRAKNHAKEMAEHIWKEVFEPFTNKEVGEILKSIVEKTKC